MNSAYNKDLSLIAKDESKKIDVFLKEGVYTATFGPSYETKSEIKMFRSMGVDCVGMSTLYEVIAANFLNMRVLSFSCITNPAADRHTGELNHQEVIDALKIAGPNLSKLVTNCAKRIIEKS